MSLIKILYHHLRRRRRRRRRQLYCLLLLFQQIDILRGRESTFLLSFQLFSSSFYAISPYFSEFPCAFVFQFTFQYLRCNVST